MGNRVPWLFEGFTLLLFIHQELMAFVISHGPDEEWFPSEEEAVDAAFDWSVETGGDIITVSRVHQGQFFPHMEVSA